MIEMSAIKGYATLIKVGIMVLACLGVLWFGYDWGHDAAFSEQQTVIDGLRADHSEALAKAKDEGALKTQKLQDKADAIQTDYTILKMEAQNDEAAADDAERRLAAANSRLSIATKGCRPVRNPSGSPPSGSGGATQESADADRAELDPEALASLIGIARDGDRGIRDRNQCYIEREACIASYEAVRLGIRP